MFRLFLINLLKSGKDLDEGDANKRALLPPRRLRNRRIYERFDIDHKHLALMNDQDILLIRDLSEKGFSTEVSERGFKRLVIGDVYLCRIRYLGESYEAQICVRWKAKSFVGFELIKASSSMRQFMSRLIQPLEVGTSLQRVDEKFGNASDNEGMIWYQGSGANFYLWHDDDGAVKAWKLEKQDQFIKWGQGEGIKTGVLRTASDPSAALVASWKPVEVVLDKQLNSDLKQFATDVIMAMQLPSKDQLLESIVG